VREDAGVTIIGLPSFAEMSEQGVGAFLSE
jgi:hypothetical protein